MTQTYHVKVSMNQAAVVKTGLILKQGDFGIQIEIEVLDFDVSNTTPQIVFRKSQGAVESTDITASDNIYTYTLKGTELDVPGRVFCDLKLKNSTTQRISSASFMFEVVADTLDGLAEETTSYSDTIAQLLGGVRSQITQESVRAQTSETLLRTNINNEVDRATSAEALKVNKPIANPDGTNGQFLRTNGDGTTQWDNPAAPTSEQIQTAVDDWLGNHPEAVTTVEDGAISPVKFDANVLKTYKRAGNVLIYFPSLETGGYSGSSALMVFDDGQAVLFDANATVNKTAVLDYYQNMYDNGLFNNICAIVISHFHWDHYQNLEDIVETFPHAGCHAYIPMNPQSYYTQSDAQSILDARNSVISTLTNAGISYTEVEEDTVANIRDGFCTIDLFNSNTTSYTYYKTNTTYYNDYSMVALVKIGDIFCMFPGDIQRAAQDYIMSNRDLPHLFLYAVHHHGIQNDDSIKYLNEISPEYTIISTNYARGLVSAASSMAANYATKYLGSTGYSDYIFAVQKDAGEIIQGKELQKSGWYYSYINLYVDNTYTGTIHDGSEEHPFTNINEINMFINEQRNVQYTIYIKASEIPYPMIWLRDFVSDLSLIGVANAGIDAPSVEGAYIKDCIDVEFNNINFVGGRITQTDFSTIYANNADIVLVGGSIDSEDPDYTLKHGCIQLRRASVYMSGTILKNALNGFICNRECKITTNGISFDNIRQCYPTYNTYLYIRGKDTVNDITYYLYSTSGTSSTNIKFSNGSITLSELEDLCAKNTFYVASDIFRLGNALYMIIGTKVIKIKDIMTIEDNISNLDDAVNDGIYHFTSSAQNVPTIGSKSGGTLLNLKYDSNYWQQIVTNNNISHNKIAMRKHGPNGYNEWVIIE